MPFATFTKVREVSSEDNVHLAENLIKNEPGKKWKTKNIGEKSAYVILEMMESYQVTGIDIGNEHSAFVEVLVGQSICAPDAFQEILITCSFMTPTESKSSNNCNRVRCFNREALVPSVADKKWSLVKIICTQPFNKHVQYGLSFIKIHVIVNEKINSMISKNKVVPDQLLNKAPHIGKLIFREDSPDSESENSSSLFNRWKKSKGRVPEETAATAIRKSSKSPVIIQGPTVNIQKSRNCHTLKSNDISVDHNRDELLFGDENYSNKDQRKLVRLSEKIELDKEKRRIEKEKELNKTKRNSVECSKSIEFGKVENPSSSKHSVNSKHISMEPVKKRQSTPPQHPIKKIKSSIKSRPFGQLLNGVVLVISGIQNPDRGDLRNKAIALGAKYKADWDSSCTHLICAFKNTPKYNQVKGKGKIVTRRWIEKCYTSKKYLPWRRYALDSKELSMPESDEEIVDDTHSEEIIRYIPLIKSVNESEDKNNIEGLYDTDEKPKFNDTNLSNNSNLSSECDTDDEINRMKQTKNIVHLKATSKADDIYEASTDEEDYMEEKRCQKL